MLDGHSVAITGVGVLSPFGIGFDAFTEGIREGRSALRMLDAALWKLPQPCLAGFVEAFRPEEFDADHRFLRLPRVTQLSLAAASMAVKDAFTSAGDPAGEDTGVFSGIMHGVMDQTEQYFGAICDKGARFANPLLFQNTVPNAIVSEISLRFGCKGMAITVTSGAASGLLAVGLAVTALRSRQIRHAIVVAGEELSPRTLATYRALNLLSPGDGGEEICCPFDRRRNGMILAEGAVAFVLEIAQSARARGAKVYAGVAGAGAAHDGARGHGFGLEAAMEKALRAARISASQLNYVAAAANSTHRLDEAESAAIRRMAGSCLGSVRVSSIKAMIGESFSVAGLFSVAACLSAMRHGFLPPSVNCASPDRFCDVPHVAHSGATGPRVALANAACLPGNCASVALIHNHSIDKEGHL